ncbi:hypothetical protein [Brunnivagina elsteri]|uniref:Uncharacterized protein n=1 Tax=Brunnivagina elsteri CCALA 953 TaxID=987040 RepID=A0A2A2TJ70_9CYAN|nr:hypothetical protein [Calothrix elsteri]PAX54847.1 hypothetical protein CK510_12045 [Calothrix elsteri CCALA 953]
MSIIREIPWVSLTLALLTYSSLGWVISSANITPIGWVGVAIAILILVGILTIPGIKFAQYSNYLFKSNTRTFVVTVFAAFSLFLMIAWFRLFLDTLVVIAATILVRIDFQAAGLRQVYGFATLSFISLLGLAIGALIHGLMKLPTS